MSKLVISYLVIGLVTYYNFCMVEAKSITKRQSCFGGQCNNNVIPTPCGGGQCNNNNIIPAPCGGRTPCGNNSPCGGRVSCGGGLNTPCGGRVSCGGNIDVPCGGNADCSGRTTPCGGGGCSSVRTCSSCISGCSNRCSNYGCLDSCLDSCSCEGENTEVRNRCCDVLHPKTCFTDENSTKRCVVRRHRECSDLCTSSIVSLQEGEEGGRSRCQTIRNYPYLYCGNYERHNCGQCYTCGGSYNPSGCLRRPECTDRCKNVLPTLPPDPIDNDGIEPLALN